jgi:shikimate kinase
MKRGPIVITGFMGCGKTEVARRLGERLNLNVIDLDEAITQQCGRSPATFIAEDGEIAFRAIETRVLQEILLTQAGSVISLGGGAWIEAVNRTEIARADGQAVWLDTPFEVCWERIESSGDDRPLGKSKEQALSLYQRRCPVYELANFRVTASHSDSIDYLASRIQSLTSQASV